MHRRGEGVVRGLRHIDIVVRVQELFSRQLVAAVGDHLVDIHVRLRARTRLPHNEREMSVQLTGEDLVADAADQGAFFRAHPLGQQLAVGDGRRLFQHGKRSDDLHGHRFDTDADGEILMRALRLRAPVAVRRDADLSHRVPLYPVFHTFPRFRLICYLHSTRRGADVNRRFYVRAAGRRKNAGAARKSCVTPPLQQKGPFSSAENGPFFPSLYFASSAYSGASAVAGAMAELVSLAHSSACSQNIRVMVDGCAAALVAMAMSR